jgi:hypothetical protein
MTKYKVGMHIVLVARVSLSNLRLCDRVEYHPIVGATDSASHSTGEILLKLPAKAKLVQFACLFATVFLQLGQEPRYVIRNDNTNKETTYQVCFLAL